MRTQDGTIEKLRKAGILSDDGLDLSVLVSGKSFGKDQNAITVSGKRSGVQTNSNRALLSSGSLPSATTKLIDPERTVDTSSYRTMRGSLKLNGLLKRL